MYKYLFFFLFFKMFSIDIDIDVKFYEDQDEIVARKQSMITNIKYQIKLLKKEIYNKEKKINNINASLIALKNNLKINEDRLNAEFKKWLLKQEYLDDNLKNILDYFTNFEIIKTEICEELDILSSSCVIL